VQAPWWASCIRWTSAISHSCTSAWPPNISAARWRMSWTAPSVSCIDISSRQAVVTMHRPVSRSQSIDKPMQPAICWTAGMAVSRM
jgi:hypothetical protein